MNLIPFLVLWVLLALTVLALFVWRKMVASKEDDNLHVLDGASAAKSAEQLALAQKLEYIDKWGKISTIVTVAYGLVMAAFYVWMSWVQNSRLGA